MPDTLVSNFGLPQLRRIVRNRQTTDKLLTKIRLMGSALLVTVPLIPTPVHHTLQRVVVSLRENVKVKLDDLQRKGIVEKVRKATEWISTMVIASKHYKITIFMDQVMETATKENKTTWGDGLPESLQDARMNDSGESREDATDGKIGVMSAKTKTKIGFWNMRMYETGKLAHIHILGINESRWTGSGTYQTSTGETVLYSDRDNNKHHEGVAIVLKKGMEKCLIEWKPINSRLMKITMKGKHISPTIIQCYAPTNQRQ